MVGKREILSTPSFQETFKFLNSAKEFQCSDTVSISSISISGSSQLCMTRSRKYELQWKMVSIPTGFTGNLDDSRFAMQENKTFYSTDFLSEHMLVLQVRLRV